MINIWLLKIAAEKWMKDTGNDIAKFTTLEEVKLYVLKYLNNNFLRKSKLIMVWGLNHINNYYFIVLWHENGTWPLVEGTP